MEMQTQSARVIQIVKHAFGARRVCRSATIELSIRALVNLLNKKQYPDSGFTTPCLVTFFRAKLHVLCCFFLFDTTLINPSYILVCAWVSSLHPQMNSLQFGQTVEVVLKTALGGAFTFNHHLEGTYGDVTFMDISLFYALLIVSEVQPAHHEGNAYFRCWICLQTLQEKCVLNLTSRKSRHFGGDSCPPGVPYLFQVIVTESAVRCRRFRGGKAPAWPHDGLAGEGAHGEALAGIVLRNPSSACLSIAPGTRSLHKFLSAGND